MPHFKESIDRVHWSSKRGEAPVQSFGFPSYQRIDCLPNYGRSREGTFGRGAQHPATKISEIPGIGPVRAAVITLLNNHPIVRTKVILDNIADWQSCRSGRRLIDGRVVMVAQKPFVRGLNL